MVAHAFNHSAWEAEASRPLSSRPAWSIQQVPGQPGLHKEMLYWNFFFLNGSELITYFNLSLLVDDRLISNSALKPLKLQCYKLACGAADSAWHAY